jgi:caffeoyl-CoA O-methyltransferase
MARWSDRWYATNEYAREVFGDEPPHIEASRVRADAAGIPNIAVTPELGRFLSILVRTTRGRLALEVGTLGGYSTLWLLEGLQSDGKVITIEYLDEHADFAEREFADAGVADRVDLRRGDARSLLPAIAEALGPESVDVVFIDADKESYPDYYEMTSGLVVPGGLLLIDNIFGTGTTWIDDLSTADSAATDEMNRRAAADERFETAGLFVRSGLMVARRRGA